VENKTSDINPRLFTSLINSLVTKDDKSFYGITYNISLTDDGSLRIDFRNPKDLSYNPEVLFGMMEDKVVQFFKYLSVDWNSQVFKEVKSKFKYFMDGEDITPKTEKVRYVYLNKNDKDDLNRIAKSVTVFDWSSKISKLYSPVECKFQSLRCESQDQVVVDVNVKFLYPEYDSILLDNQSFARALDELFSDDNFYDYTTQEFTNPFMDFVWNKVLIIDQEYMFVTAHIDYFDKSGRVKWWDHG
jgi:hypothetical protein